METWNDWGNTVGIILLAATIVEIGLIGYAISSSKGYVAGYLAPDPLTVAFMAWGLPAAGVTIACFFIGRIWGIGNPLSITAISVELLVAISLFVRAWRRRHSGDSKTDTL